MPENNPNPVVVAIGNDHLESALRYAVAEAARVGTGVHLVHAVQHLHDGPEFVLVEETDRDRIGRQTLGVALERTRDLAGDAVPVTCELLNGHPVPAVVSAADDARVIVLEHRDLSRMRRVVTRSIASGVAARARVPVVSVPSSWSADREHAAEETVTVGVDIPDRSEPVLRVAAEAAARRGATLRVVPTWSFPSAYDDIVMTRTEDERWAKRATEEIQTVLDGLGDVMAGVPIRIDAQHAPAADALVEASRESQLLVVGRHDPVVPIGSHLGPVARAVLREAECPVLLADSRPPRHWSLHPRREGERASSR